MLDALPTTPRSIALRDADVKNMLPPRTMAELQRYLLVYRPTDVVPTPASGSEFHVKIKMDMLGDLSSGIWHSLGPIVGHTGRHMSYLWLCYIINLE
jgi:hypothetical protein